MAFGGYLQANTAADVIVGPFLDEDDGKTAEVGLTITQADVRLSKNAGNMAQKNEATSLSHDELGNYVCKFDTTDTNTEGILTLMIHESGALPIKMDYMVLAQAAYISLLTAKDTGFMDINVKAVSGDTTAADNLESACDDYSAERGLTGTALPAAAADAAGGLPISDAGALDVDAMNTNVAAILVDTAEIGGAVGADISADIAAVKAETAAIVNDTDLIDDGTSGLAKIATDVAAILSDTGTDGVTVSAAGVTAIWAKAMSDLAAGAPSATASVLTAINYVYEAWRNKTITNGTNDEIEVYKDDDSTKLCEAPISDDGTNFTKSKYAAVD